MKESGSGKRKAKTGSGAWKRTPETEKNNGLRSKKSSREEHRVDAKAPFADEGRDQLRKAAGSRK